MRIVFYYDNLPPEHAGLLRLDNPRLAHGYVAYLNKSMNPDARTHVRVRVITVDRNGSLSVNDVKLVDFERRLNDNHDFWKDAI